LTRPDAETDSEEDQPSLQWLTEGIAISQRVLVVAMAMVVPTLLGYAIDRGLGARFPVGILLGCLLGMLSAGWQLRRLLQWLEGRERTSGKISPQKPVVAPAPIGRTSPVGAGRRLRSWAGLLLLALVQVLLAIPVFGLAALLGGTHLQQALWAAGVVWPLVLLSYVPMLVPTKSPAILVQMYLAIMIRMFGTLGGALVLRQIAAPLALDSWFLYISAFYLAGLVAETSLVVASLKR